MKKTKSVKARSQRQQRQQNGHPLTSKLASLLDPEASWDKDQLGDVLHWMRQVLALACGLLWGAIPLGGATWIVVLLGFLYTVWHTFKRLLSAEPHGAPSFDPMK